MAYDRLRRLPPRMADRGSDGCGVDDLLPAEDGGALLGPEPDLAGHPLRWDVRRVDDRDQAAQEERVAGEIAGGGGGLGRVPVALQAGADVVADLDLLDAVHVLRGQPAVPGELTGVAQDHRPQPEALAAVEALVPRH